MSKLIILVGVPCSGKTTWARNYIKENKNTVRLNRDDFRMMLRTEGFCENKVEMLISDVLFKGIESALLSKFDVIVDNTHVKLKYINDLIKAFNHLADIEFKVFDTPDTAELVRRNHHRGDSEGKFIPLTVMVDMQANFTNLKSIFDFKPIPKSDIKSELIPFDPSLPACYIVDIDGTVADCKGIRSPYDGSKLNKDRVIEQTAIVLGYIDADCLNTKIIYLSGREDKWKDDTINWLIDNELPYHGDIFMRATNDMRNDAIVKKELYDRYIKGRYNVLGVFDDRLRVCNMWYEQGLFVFNVNQGLKEF